MRLSLLSQSSSASHSAGLTHPSNPSSMSPGFGFLWLTGVAWEASQLSQTPLVLTRQEKLGQPPTWANSNFRKTDLAAKARREVTALAGAGQPPTPLFHLPKHSCPLAQHLY